MDRHGVSARTIRTGFGRRSRGRGAEVDGRIGGPIDTPIAFYAGAPVTGSVLTAWVEKREKKAVTAPLP
jgi:hypothetical protein